MMRPLRRLGAASGLALAVLPFTMLGGGGLAHAEPDTPAKPLETPTRIEASGEAINVDIGHAAPFVTDWNGDGKADLLVGQFGEVHLRIYINEGTAQAPRFGAHSLFEAGGATASIPSG